MLKDKLPRYLPVQDPSDFEDPIPAGKVRVAHKTGELDRVQHDIGIIRLPQNRSYILAIFTDHLDRDSDGADWIADLSRLVYQEMTKKDEDPFGN